MVKQARRNGEGRRLLRSVLSRSALAAAVLTFAAASLLAGRVLAEEPAAVAPPEAETGEYILGVEDRLTISVWREADLTRTVIVRPDGKLTFPLVGDIQAAGRTASQLDAQITAALAQFIREPVVTVIVEEINNFKIYMIGEVARQGEVILRRRTRLLQAIALAGGLTPFADKSKVTVIREENGREVRINVDYRRVASGERPESNIFLKPGDTIVAN